MQICPDSSPVGMELGRFYIALRKYKEAAETLLPIYRQHPEILLEIAPFSVPVSGAF